MAVVDCLQEEAPVVGQSVGLPACRLYHAVRALDPTAGYGEPGVRDNPHRMPPEQPANHSKRRSPVSRHSQQTSPTSAFISAPSFICVLSIRTEQKGVVPFFRTRSLHREAQAPPELKRAHPAERALYPLGAVAPGVGACPGRELLQGDARPSPCRRTSPSSSSRRSPAAKSRPTRLPGCSSLQEYGRWYTGTTNRELCWVMRSTSMRGPASIEILSSGTGERMVTP